MHILNTHTFACWIKTKSSDRQTMMGL
uniref:Uncharacterized protein n=1 Tax=Anguilla anguilla TaxID=7936 RepID=A0A0E9XRE5_ANGAN